jgi:hypothetical protein
VADTPLEVAFLLPSAAPFGLPAAVRNLEPGPTRRQAVAPRRNCSQQAKQSHHFKLHLGEVYSRELVHFNLPFFLEHFFDLV